MLKFLIPAALTFAAVGVGLTPNATISLEFWVARGSFWAAGIILFIAYLIWLWEAPCGLLSSTPWQAIWGVVVVAIIVPGFVISTDWVDARLQLAYPFCFFRLVTTTHEKLDGAFQLSTTGVGVVKGMKYWIAPAASKSTTDPYDPYYSLDKAGRPSQTCFSGTYASTKMLPVGEYRIEFVDDKGGWNEFLRIYIEDGQLKQTIRVIHHDGRVLYTEPGGGN